MYEVEATKEANDLLDHYRSEYEKHHRSKPFIQVIAAAVTFMKDMLRQQDFDRCQRVITAFLKTNGDNDWYKRQGWSLECLKRNIEAVSASIPDKPKFQGPIAVEFYSQCPLCTESFTICCSSIKEMEARACMQACPKCGGHVLSSGAHIPPRAAPKTTEVTVAKSISLRDLPAAISELQKQPKPNIHNDEWEF